VKHVPALDGLRAVAVVAVLLFHSEWSFASGGFLGVSLFFTLSGYLIASLLIAEFSQHQGVSFRSFYGRRVRRLLPAAYLCLLLVAMAGTLWTASQLSALPGDLIASVANVANWRFAFSSTSYQDLFVSDPSPVAHFWSLAIEEQIYLLLPIVVVVALRRGRRTLAITTGLLLAASVCATLLTADRDLVYNGTHTRAAEVLVGVALAQYVSARRTEQDVPPRLVGINGFTGLLALSAFILLFAFASLDQAWIYRGGLPLVSIVSVVLIAAVVSGRFPSRVLEHPWLVGIGALSYGIYLFHWPVFLVLTDERTGLEGVGLFVVRCLVTGALAAMSFWLIERPVRTGRVGSRNRVMLPALAVGSAVVIAAAFVLVPTPRSNSTEQLLALGSQSVVEFTPSADGGRAGETAGFPDDGTQPTTTAPSPPVVVVVGSDPGAADALEQAGGFEVVDAVRPECSLTPAVIPGCSPLTEQLIELQAAHEPVVVVVSTGAAEDAAADAQNAAAVGNVAALNELAVVHEAVLASLLSVMDTSLQGGADVVLYSGFGKRSSFYPRLSRAALVRPAVGEVESSKTDLVERTRALASVPDPGSAGAPESADPVRVLVIGDSTSLMMAQGLNEGGGGAIEVLWAGANGCPLAPVSALRSVTGEPWREISCEPPSTKLPPLLTSFAPDLVLQMSGASEMNEHRFPGDPDGYVASDPAFLAARDRAMEELLSVVGPDMPVLVADFPTVRLGTYATAEMLEPARLDALNAQVLEWDRRWPQVQRFAYRETLEATEARVGSIRFDGVHADAEPIAKLARTVYVQRLLEQYASLDTLLSSRSTAPAAGGE
jgi:peptidoglycan/LPS O-acetylase OafA/YrhL